MSKWKRCGLFALTLSLVVMTGCDDDPATGTLEEDISTMDSSGTDVSVDGTGEDTAGVDATNTDTTGTDTAGTDSTGTDTTGTDTTGTDTTGTDTTGTDTTGIDTTGTDTTGTDTTGTDTNTPGALGTTCTDGADCTSTYCFTTNDGSQVCSDCSEAGDCGANFNCVFDSTAGYGVCVGNASLGEACSADAECVSGFCNNSVCSECNANTDCTAGGVCNDDTSGSGYWICSGGLGDICTADDQCGSTYCFDAGNGNQVCSECKVTGDCGVSQDCDIARGDDYATCVGTGDLGANCTADDQCIPGTFCNGGSCSECGADSDCTDGGLCQEDTTAGYFVCAGGLGDDCTDGSQCSSGYCYTQGGANRCSECAVTTDCGLQQECQGQQNLGYAVCVGTGDFGANCQDDSQCQPGLTCANGACSQCAVDADCPAGSACSVGSGGFSLCQFENGEPCQINDQCVSTYCWDGQGRDVCGECNQDSDCGTGGNCTYEFGDPYARCTGSAALGEACSSGADCGSGFCNNSLCSECGADADCSGDGAACVDDSSGSGYWVCQDGIGAFCQNDSDCASGFCYDTGFGSSFCSECNQDSDCASNQACDFQFNGGGPGSAAYCVGNADLGDNCGSDADCANGVCNGGVCSLCGASSECGSGGSCADHTSVGFSYCNGLGDRGCEVGTECASGFCHDVRFSQAGACSECEDNGDCQGNDTCSLDFQAGYWVCN